jgi:hypothetical protein
MPRNQKELRNCHECGLEAFDECESQNKHVPADETLAPCKFCSRNPAAVGWYDFYEEQWTLDTVGNPIIEDPDPHAVTLLKTLHGIIQGECDLIRVAVGRQDHGK